MYPIKAKREKPIRRTSMLLKLVPPRTTLAEAKVSQKSYMKSAILNKDITKIAKFNI